MRSLSKRNADWRLAQRHQHPPTTADEATSAWKNFHDKDKTRDICLLEQFGLCAYSEIILDEHDLGMHLDHVEPKSLNPSRTFDHTNLVLSAIDSVKLPNMARQDVFGGHFRFNNYSNTEFIHPLMLDSRRFFHYASNGEVQPATGLSASDARKARYTIAVLNLNAPVLINRRRRWLEELDIEIDTLLDNREALAHFAEVELCETNGKLRPFHSAARQRFGRMGEKVIASRCAICG